MTRRKAPGPPAKGTLGRAVYDDLAGMLADTDQYPPGTRLPSYMKLRQRYGVSQGVVSSAMESLAYERRVRIGPGGVVVLGKKPMRAQPPTPSPIERAVRSRIVYGGIKPVRLSVGALADEFKASRDSVRSALAPLVAEGLLVAVHGTDSYVSGRRSPEPSP
ncbi:regulatory protein, gntR family [Streptomyces sp. 2131.1]|uniref:GntR family transcriptional regulator n=1 Tax=Streptomyces sp. 2131.1 TaxID=1855346 RepID=UPI00089B151E|nr:GntR family transcriptional regulator [Streptomyces sp. 2131.1]SEE84684.1 regulatory protein, gntR family [Streptomyces sp. 2131.1]